MDQVYLKFANEYIAGIRGAIRAEALQEYIETFNTNTAPTYMTPEEELAAATDNGTVPFKKFGDCPDPLYIAPNSFVTFSGYVLIDANSCAACGQYTLGHEYAQWLQTGDLTKRGMSRSSIEDYYDVKITYVSSNGRGFSQECTKHILLEKGIKRRLTKHCIQYLRTNLPLYAFSSCNNLDYTNNCTSCVEGAKYKSMTQLVINFDFYLQEQMAYLHREIAETANRNNAQSIELIAREKQLADQLVAFADREKQLAEQTAKLELREKRLEDRIAVRNKQMREEFGMIDARNKHLDKRAIALCNQEKLLEEKERRLEELELKLDARDKHLFRRAEELEVKLCAQEKHLRVQCTSFEARVAQFNKQEHAFMQQKRKIKLQLQEMHKQIE